MEWLNFRHLYAFWMVCRFSGFKNAANEMAVAQSAVSDQVSQLEDYLGEKLLDRTTRSVRMTERGTQLFRYAEKIFEQSREINMVIKDQKASEGPLSLKVGIVGGLSRNFIFRTFSKMLSEFPTAAIDVITGSYDELSDLLKKFELDLIVTLELPQKKDLALITYKNMGQSPMCLAGNKSLLSAITKNVTKRRNRAPRSKIKPDSVKPQIYELYNFKFPHEVASISDFLQTKFGIKTRVRLDTDDISLLRFFATTTNGLALIPEVGVQEDIISGALDRITIPQLPPIHFYGIYLKQGIHQKVIDTLLNTNLIL